MLAVPARQRQEAEDHLKQRMANNNFHKMKMDENSMAMAIGRNGNVTGNGTVNGTGRPKKRDSRNSHSLHSKTLRPIQTTELEMELNENNENEEHNHLLSSDGNATGAVRSSTYTTTSTSTSTAAHLRTKFSQTQSSSKSKSKNRQRSISPHARAILSRTFSRSRSRSRSRSSRSRSRSRSSRLIDEDEYGYDDENSDNVSVSSSSSSRSSSSSSYGHGHGQHANAHKQMLVAVLSCRSDAYVKQKAPGSTSMLPRKAPSALKNFHELAVGVKDAYEAMGATPVKLDEGGEEYQRMTAEEREARKVLFEFMGNINFLLALVDEVATDSATRGALKDDAAFKNLRDQIKKGNKVLERMLVRRDNKYTLFFRLVQIHDTKDLLKMKSWNQKVEIAVMALSNDATDKVEDGVGGAGAGSDMASVASEASAESSRSSRGIMSRGRAMLRTAGRVRTRRATPTPKMRNKSTKDGKSFASMADDGYARSTPVTASNLDKLQLSMSSSDGEKSSSSSSGITDLLQKKNQPMQKVASQKFLAPKDELVGMIRDLKEEKNANENEQMQQHPADLKPNWLPKADIPTTVPILPVEYIHRHRLMKQVVNSLINCSISNESESKAHIITSITSRHADKAGNGKTTLAVAAIQSVEVRERFSDGIAWIRLGRNPLTDNDIRRLYEELYEQLLQREIDLKENEIPSHIKNMKDEAGGSNKKTEAAGNATFLANSLSKNKCHLKGNDLQGMKEDLGRIVSKRNVLICLDDVWRLEDAEKFIFEPSQKNHTIPGDETKSPKNGPICPYRFLITTRSPGILASHQANEVYVRIFSEHEAVKLLLYAAGRRLHGGKNAPAFNQARVIVKGCGNSPLALRLAGGMLRTSNRNWTLSSPAWTSLVEQCKASLEEASKIRSFVNSVGRIVDMSFITVPDYDLRASLRRCFVTFAMVFHDNEWLLTGRGVPRGIVERLFYNVISGMKSESNADLYSPETIIDMLEHMNLLYRARHGTTSKLGKSDANSSNSSGKSLMNGSINVGEDFPDDEASTSDDLSSTEENGSIHVEHTSYMMHESIKYIAEEMSRRTSTSFAPKGDEFTAFGEELINEAQTETKSHSWFSNAAKYLFSPLDSETVSSGTTDQQFHELMVCVLNDGKKQNSPVGGEKPNNNRFKGLNVDKYVLSYLPTHLIRAQMFDDTSSLLLDFDFIGRRIKILGILEATKRHMGDLTDLRRQVQKKAKEDKAKNGNSEKKPDPPPLDFDGSKSAESSAMDSSPLPQDATKYDIDITRTQREACRRVIDAVRRAEFQPSAPGNSINIAVCLTIVAEFLLKARITRDAISRFEEALEMFHKSLGKSHVDVARALNVLGKAYMKAGEEGLALSKLSEAYRVYESCDALREYDAISNTLLIATLLIDNGDWDNAALKYDEVIAMKQEVHGFESVVVAKTINDYAIVLAKHNRMSESLRQYEAAREVYAAINKQDKFSFDITLIELNIASIKSKLGNYEGALESYERGVKGLRAQIKKENDENEGINNNRVSAQKRHLVSAMGRIGSMRMKLKDNAGALKAYLTLIKEVDNKSPTPSQMEKARAHVKCATIFRQTGTKENNALAISHLSQALQMYTILHGVSHKDTKAIGSSLRQWQKIDASMEN